jgi:hypothetical protein
MTKLKDLAKNPANPRMITPERAEMLKDSLEEFGPLDGIVYNRARKELVGGHQRGTLHPDAEVVTEKRYEPPTKKGTTATGYVVLANGERITFREVHWPEEAKHLAATVAANKQGGEWDRGKLQEVILHLDTLNYEIQRTGFTMTEIENLVAPVVHVSEHDRTLGQGGDGAEPGKYTRKIQSPIYEPRGDRPDVSSLVDRSKTEELLGEIGAAADLPEEVTRFLRYAAGRHSVFNYEQIAEYYAHAPEPVQKLMERSALVIIDFDQAIDLGFVALSEAVAEAYRNG